MDVIDKTIISCKMSLIDIHDMDISIWISWITSKLIRRLGGNFGMKQTKPSKHRSRPSEQSRRTSLHVRLGEVASLYVSNAEYYLWHGAAYVMKFRNEITQFETHRRSPTLLQSLANTYVFSSGSAWRRVSNTLFHPVICSKSNFYLWCQLVQFLR